jgi:O-antigen/teichoic acid export membrane protein
MLGALPVLAGTAERIEAVVHHSNVSWRRFLALAIPGSVGLFFVSDSALGLIYGQDRFAAATPVVHVVCWVLVLRVLTHVFGQFLVVNGRERRTLRILVINTIVLAFAAPVLVYEYGLIGAGFSVLLLRAVDTFQHYWAVRSDYRWMETVNAAWAPGSGKRGDGGGADCRSR